MRSIVLIPIFSLALTCAVAACSASETAPATGTKLTAANSTVGATANISSNAASGSTSGDAAAAGAAVAATNAPAPVAAANGSSTSAMAAAGLTLADIANGESKALASLPTGATQLSALCSRPGKDKVRQVFCAQNPPTIHGLTDLQVALGLNFVTGKPTGTNSNAIKQGNGNQGNPSFVLTGHSSSLVARYTSAVNPRAIIFSDSGVGLGTAAPDPNFVAMGFVRGEQFAELVAQDPSTKIPAFFLVHFDQACNSTPAGCTPGELLTPEIEQNWTGVTIYEDTDLANTLFDCLECHQTAGPGTPKSLRMQERKTPWTHFLRDDRPGGMALIADFQAAHGNSEMYAGIPPAVIPASDPLRLERLIENNGFDKPTIPNEFITGTIEKEVDASAKGQPVLNTPPGVSATWSTLFANYVAGKVIATPYHDVKITDPAKLTQVTAAYQSFLAGATPSTALPDIRDVLLTERAYEMGFALAPGGTGEQILTTACTQCHNSNLDQTLSRAKFNVNLSLMTAAEKTTAVQRINLPLNDPKHMPPARFRDLSPADIATLTTLLNQ